MLQLYLAISLANLSNYRFYPFQAVFIYYLYQYSPVTYGDDYEYPKWAEIMGLLIAASSMIWVPIYAIYYIVRGVTSDPEGTIREVSLHVDSVDSAQ